MFFFALPAEEFGLIWRCEIFPSRFAGAGDRHLIFSAGTAAGGNRRAMVLPGRLNPTPVVAPCCSMATLVAAGLMVTRRNCRGRLRSGCRNGRVWKRSRRRPYVQA